MMKLKGWMLRKVNGMGNPASRAEPQSHAALAAHGAGAPQTHMHEPRMRAVGKQRGGVPDDAEHLGPYSALIGAIREELEHFVTTQLRLHLAIAERDRYVLASVEVECDESNEHRDLLRRFIGEFKPEQIKHYLAREVIAGLRNASAIDLSQFAGLNVETEGTGCADADNYGELLAELESGMPRSTARPYRVTLVGRWSEIDPAVRAVDAKSARSTSPRTPLATRPVSLDI